MSRSKSARRVRMGRQGVGDGGDLDIEAQVVDAAGSTSRQEQVWCGWGVR